MLFRILLFSECVKRAFSILFGEISYFSSFFMWLFTSDKLFIVILFDGTILIGDLLESTSIVWCTRCFLFIWRKFISYNCFYNKVLLLAFSYLFCSNLSIVQMEKKLV